MEELIEKLEQLKSIILKEEVVLSFLDEKKKVLEDKKLKELVLEYQNGPNEKLKKEIEDFPSFLAYKHKETELMLLIFQINQNFKVLKSESFSCKGDIRESN